jgi:outer membrane protein assembly factor BamB
MLRAALLLLFASLAHAASDWPSFRGPNGSGVADSVNLPVHFGPGENVVWKTTVPGGQSSPVIAGDRIFLTAFEGEKLLTICVDRKTGKIAWRREAPRDRSTKSHGANTPTSPSPVTDGASVFVFFEDFGLVSYGMDGNERWRRPLGPFNNPYGMAASPILAGNILLLLCDQDTNSFLIAVDGSDGRVRWKAERPEATHGFSTPVIYQGQAIVSGAHQVAAYSVATGEKIWWINGMAWQAKSIPVIAGDTLYVHSWMAAVSEIGIHDVRPFAQVLAERDANHDGKLSKDEVADPDMKTLWFLFDLNRDGFLDENEWKINQSRETATNGLFAIKLGGKGDVTATHVLWRHEKSLPNIPSPLLYQGVLYVLREGGVVTALDPKTGKVLKQGRLTGALDSYFASPVAGDGKIYTVSQEGKLSVIQAGSQWEILAVNDMKEECWATPAIADSGVYVRTKSALYRFEKRG